jgi:hypothetical protein
MSKPPLRPDDDSAWSQYAETILEIANGDTEPLCIDLRRPLSDADRRTLATLGPTSHFGVVTAANPAGTSVAQASNQKRHAALKSWLAEHGQEHRAITGSSPDGEHREPGFAIWLERDDVVSIARRFDQSAIFWFDGGAFWLVGALVDAKPRKLP